MGDLILRQNHAGRIELTANMSDLLILVAINVHRPNAERLATMHLGPGAFHDLWLDGRAATSTPINEIG